LLKELINISLGKEHTGANFPKGNAFPPPEPVKGNRRDSE
jgi:hypothetical protein